MGRKLASFDLEIATEIPDGVDDWRSLRPKISCAAIALSNGCEPLFFQGMPYMRRGACRDLVRYLQDLVGEGYQILTWNGCSFDFGVLAQESEMYEECALLALDHVDLMLRVTFEKGWYLSLQKALCGAGLAGKLKEVRLGDGTVVKDMDGAQAPTLWAAGECNAVLAYLREDVVQLLGLAKWVLANGCIRWTSNRGSPMSVQIDNLVSVRECLAIQEPDTTWMTDPPTRAQFFRWMPNPPI
ncbi:MAG: ribonuclease H-like domain-containing protein [Chloroflexota bacterium]